MSKDKTYNGWTNYETWCVNLWIDNEESSYRFWREEAQSIWDDTEDREEALRTLSDRLKDYHEEDAQGIAAGNVYADLLSSSLSEVDWLEIAQAVAEEIIPAKETKST